MSQKLTGNLLAKAAKHITRSYGNVTAIQFEDGSGHKFNYQIDCGKWEFIDLGAEWLRTINVHIDGYKESIKNNDVQGALYFFRQIVGDFHENMGKDLKHLFELCKQQSNDAVLSELFS